MNGSDEFEDEDNNDDELNTNNDNNNNAKRKNQETLDKIEKEFTDLKEKFFKDKIAQLKKEVDTVKNGMSLTPILLSILSPHHHSIYINNK